LFTYTIVAKGQCFTTGAVHSGTITNDAAIGTIAFANPSYAQTSDANRAIATMVISLLSTKTNYLKAVNFNAGIPMNATICGIEIDIQKMATGINVLTSVTDDRVSLLKEGTITGNNKAKSGKWATGDTYYTYGSNNDLWGTSLTPADVNDVNFGLVISVDIVGVLALLPTARVNYIRMNVYYTLPVLPVKLTSFEAVKLNNNNIQVKWSAQNEDNVAKYIIEHSANGHDWNNIHESLPVHTAPSGNYQIDLPAPGFSQNYYRLAIQSKDGSTQLSPVKMISNSRSNTIQVISTPGNNLIYIKNITSKEQAFIIDMHGRVITQNMLYPGNLNPINISALAKGIYLLKIGQVTGRFIKM
jgi:hypothetical protein